MDDFWFGNSSIKSAFPPSLHGRHPKATRRTNSTNSIEIPLSMVKLRDKQSLIPQNR